MRMPGDDEDDGRPIEALRELGHETSPQFLARVRGRIHRRSAVSQAANYSWYLPRTVLMEMIGLIGHLASALGGKDNKK